MTVDKDFKALMAKICHNLDFIKSLIDDKPEEAKKSITEMVNEITESINVGDYNNIKDEPIEPLMRK
jgi:hypothetical protein